MHDDKKNIYEKVMILISSIGSQVEAYGRFTIERCNRPGHSSTNSTTDYNMGGES